MARRQSSLAKLEAKQAELAEQIKAARREERARELEVEKQRYLILGRVLAGEMADDAQLAAMLEPRLNARVVKPRERQLMGLPPLG